MFGGYGQTVSNTDSTIARSVKSTSASQSRSPCASVAPFAVPKFASRIARSESAPCRSSDSIAATCARPPLQVRHRLGSRALSWVESSLTMADGASYWACWSAATGVFMNSQIDELQRKAVAGDRDSLVGLIDECWRPIRGEIDRKIGATWRGLLDADDVMQVTY